MIFATKARRHEDAKTTGRVWQRSERCGRMWRVGFWGSVEVRAEVEEGAGWFKGGALGGLATRRAG
jgi:hypothetical protein